jgi:hypothetical protein
MSRGRERPPAAEPGADQNGGYLAGEAGDSVHGSSDVERYIAGRERVLGQSLVLHRDPSVAAALLAEALGGRTFAYRYAAALLEACR